jgi:TolB-like protein
MAATVPEPLRRPAAGVLKRSRIVPELNPNGCHPMPGRRLSFGPFEVDEGAQVVLRDGNPLAIGQRGATLLAALLRRPGEVLTKGELIDAAWGDAAIEESNLSVQIAGLRKALGHTSAGGDWIATIPRVGYRFVGAADQASGASPEAERRPSIAVLPFENLSSDREQGYFADGLAEEIITALAKLPDVMVIARNSSFAYRDPGIDLRRVGEELDVRFVVAGSVRRSGERLRMSVRLADAGSGAQLWGESYDRQLADVFAIQDEVTRQVIAAIRPRLTGKPENMATGGTRNLDALDLFLRARAILSEPNVDRAINREGMRLLEQAIERDPDFVDPRVTLVVAHITELSNRWSEDGALTLAAARRIADEGVRLDASNGGMMAASSLVAMLEKDHRRLAAESEIAISLSPLDSFTNVIRGGYLVNDGRPLESLTHFEQAIRGNPAMTHLYLHHLGTGYLFAGRYETAAALFRSRILLAPRTDMSRAYLCVALGHLGHHEEAKRVWSELMEISPSYSIADRVSSWHYEDPSYVPRLLEGLRRSGLHA